MIRNQSQRTKDFDKTDNGRRTDAMNNESFVTVRKSFASNNYGVERNTQVWVSLKVNHSRPDRNEDSRQSSEAHCNGEEIVNTFFNRKMQKIFVDRKKRFSFGVWHRFWILNVTTQCSISHFLIFALLFAKHAAFVRCRCCRVNQSNDRLHSIRTFDATRRARNVLYECVNCRSNMCSHMEDHKTHLVWSHVRSFLSPEKNGQLPNPCATKFRSTTSWLSKRNNAEMILICAVVCGYRTHVLRQSVVANQTSTWYRWKANEKHIMSTWTMTLSSKQRKNNIKMQSKVREKNSVVNDADFDVDIDVRTFDDCKNCSCSLSHSFVLAMFSTFVVSERGQSSLVRVRVTCLLLWHRLV